MLLLIPFIIITIISYVYQNRPTQKPSIAYSTENNLEDAQDTVEYRDVVEKEPEEKSSDNSVLSDKTKNDYERGVINIGAVFEDYSNSTGSITSIESLLGINISTISIFKQFGHPNNKDINLDDLSFIKNSGKTLMIAWEPLNPNEEDQQIDYLSEIATGSQDSYINSFALSIKEYGSPVVIRFAHEMNGDWYPWGNRPDEYKTAYRYIHDKFVQLGVSNVQWMWSINSNSVPDEPIASVSKYYPGNEYVDIIGIDGFNYGTTQNWSSWISFIDIFSDAYSFLSTNYSKPIVISEMASAEQGGDKSVWVDEMFDDLNNEFTNIDEIIWFNLIKEADWRFDSTQSSLEAFKNNLQ
jgi:beta-mannanase